MVGWKGKDAVKDGVVAFSCLLNCLRVSLLGFSSFCLILSMMRLTLSGGCPFCKEVVYTSFFKCWGEHRMSARLVRDLMTLSSGGKEGAQEL